MADFDQTSNEDFIELSRRDKQTRSNINERHMRAGVRFIDPDHTYIDAGVVIGAGTVIYPGNVLQGETVIGPDCTLYPNNRIVDCRIGARAKIESSLLEGATVGEGTGIGPYAHLRKGTQLGRDCRVGNFVETKNVTVDDCSKISHLAYCGDGEIGKACNISCGVIFSNYDGVKKHKTTVGDGAFVGCNANLVAPVTVGGGAYVAAGSTVTEDVPEDALAVARARQVNKEGWSKRRRETYHK